MEELFKKFRKTGKIADYLKYKEEMSKEITIKEEEKKDESKRNRNQKS